MVNGANPCSPIPGFADHILEVLKRLFSFPVMMGALLVGSAFYQARSFGVESDTWWHLRTGETILATHHWPTTDPYSFTVFGQHWIAFEWLGDALMAAASRLGGLQGLDLLLIVLSSAMLISLYVLVTVDSRNSKAGFVAAALLAPVVAHAFTLRSQMIGFVFLSLTIVALELFRKGRRWALWTLPALFTIWVNTHGSWIVGLGALFVYWVCGLKKFRLGGIEAAEWSAKEHLQLSLVFLSSLAAITITPYGTELAVFPLKVASSLPVTYASIGEWLPIFLNTAYGKYFLFLFFCVFILQITLGLVWRVPELALFLGGTVMTFLHARFILVVAPFFALILGRVLARWLEPYSRRKDQYAINGLLIVTVLGAMVHYFPTQADLEQKVADRFPERAVEYLRQHPVPEPMYNSDWFGGYLVWSLGPQHKVFIDGRSELYEKGGVLAEFIDVLQMRPGSLSVLEHYQIQSCLLERDSKLAEVLSALPDWRVVYSDATGILYVRQGHLSGAERQPRDASPEVRE